ncbi:MAG: transglutaminase domain-containing protein [Ghiorsea sp.]|nr:transglutaminase domain-containing protein [Ghiorsea sp.]
MKQLLTLLLLLASLLFWGWQIDVWWLGVVLGILLVAAWFKRGKYDFETTSFYHIAHLSALIVAIVFALYWLDDRASQAILPTVRLLPLALIPLLLFQYLHKTSLIPSSALLFFQRKESTGTWFDMSSLFVLICLFSAGALLHQDLTYFTGVSALLLALLLIQQWHQQAKLSLLLISMFLLAEVLGLAVIDGTQYVQQRLEARVNTWLLAYNDGNKASTSMGEVGRLKLSDEIIFRVETKQSLDHPLLLLEGTYQRYMGQTWFGGAWQDKTIPWIDDVWVLRNEEVGKQSMRLYQSSEHDRQTLILPPLTTHIKGLDVESLKQTQGGRFEARGLPPLIVYEAWYGQGYAWSGEVKRSDLDVSSHEVAAIAQFAKSHDLYQINYEQGAAKVVEVLHQIFLRDFMYNTWLQAPPSSNAQTPLSRFLLETKQGHCEYFATATVLILRELGIPARYALGYSMSEWDANHEMYVVRGRDAHAWAVALVDEQWVAVDNTPPNWFALEDSHQSQFQGVWDWFANVTFSFKKWRYGDSEIEKAWWYGLLLILFIFLAVRVLSRVKMQSSDAGDCVKNDEAWLKLEKALADAGLERQQGETVRQWLQRIEDGKWSLLGKLYDIRYYADRYFTKQQQQVWNNTLQEIHDFCNEIKTRP